MLTWEIRGYSATNSEVLRMHPNGCRDAMSAIQREIQLIGNPEKIVRFEVYDYGTHVIRINVH